jgi:hypothetical protein
MDRLLEIDAPPWDGTPAKGHNNPPLEPKLRVQPGVPFSPGAATKTFQFTSSKPVIFRMKQCNDGVNWGPCIAPCETMGLWVENHSPWLWYKYEIEPVRRRVSTITDPDGRPYESGIVEMARDEPLPEVEMVVNW